MIACTEHSLLRHRPSRHRPVPVTCLQREPTEQHPFLGLLPTIRQVARFRLQRLRPADRDDAIQEVVANAFVAYTKLMRSGQEKRVFAAPLADFGVRQYWTGRRVGSRTRSRDVLSDSCRRRQRVHVVSLSRCENGHWGELLVEDHRAGPDEIATIRMDFRDWLNSLTPAQRQFAERLAAGETTKEVARQFHVTPGRVSQIRRFLEHSWQEFQEPERRVA